MWLFVVSCFLCPVASPPFRCAFRCGPSLCLYALDAHSHAVTQSLTQCICFSPFLPLHVSLCLHARDQIFATATATEFYCYCCCYCCYWCCYCLWLLSLLLLPLRNMLQLYKSAIAIAHIDWIACHCSPLSFSSLLFFFLLLPPLSVCTRKKEQNSVGITTERRYNLSFSPFARTLYLCEHETHNHNQEQKGKSFILYKPMFYFSFLIFFFFFLSFPVRTVFLSRFPFLLLLYWFRAPILTATRISSSSCCSVHICPFIVELELSIVHSNRSFLLSYSLPLSILRHFSSSLSSSFTASCTFLLSTSLTASLNLISLFSCRHFFTFIVTSLSHASLLSTFPFLLQQVITLVSGELADTSRRDLNYHSSSVHFTYFSIPIYTPACELVSFFWTLLLVDNSQLLYQVEHCFFVQKDALGRWFLFILWTVIEWGRIVSRSFVRYHSRRARSPLLSLGAKIRSQGILPRFLKVSQCARAPLETRNKGPGSQK